MPRRGDDSAFLLPITARRTNGDYYNDPFRFISLLPPRRLLVLCSARSVSDDNTCYYYLFARTQQSPFDFDFRTPTRSWKRRPLVCRLYEGKRYGKIIPYSPCKHVLLNTARMYDCRTRVNTNDGWRKPVRFSSIPFRVSSRSKIQIINPSTDPAGVGRAV